MVDPLQLTQAIQALIEPSKPPRYPSHQVAVAPWVLAMKNGLLTGRPFSPIPFETTNAMSITLLKLTSRSLLKR